MFLFRLFTLERTATIAGIFTACESPERWRGWENVPRASSRRRGEEHMGEISIWSELWLQGELSLLGNEKHNGIMKQGKMTLI